MSATQQEIVSITNGLTIGHSAEVLRLATMKHLAGNLLGHYGKANGVSLEHQQTMLRHCVHAYIREKGIDLDHFNCCWRDLQRASGTIQVLDSMPE